MSGGRGDVQRALDVLAERADGAGSRVRDGADALTLGEVIAALEALTDALDPVWHMARHLAERAEQIRDREVTVRRDGSSLDVMDTALLHLRYGPDAVMVAHHLLSMGRGELVRVADGEV